VEAALEVRDRLERAGLVSYVRTTGGKGLHVVAPLRRRHGWDEVKGAARLLAEAMVRGSPKRYVAVATKAKRKGKIYVDYLRNAFGATAIGSWWFRARAHAPIARPLPWDEVTSDLDPGAFTVRTVSALPPDPWEGIDEVKQSLATRVVARLSG
jgi:bifunctional non-homologous end joining protein LigD